MNKKLKAAIIMKYGSQVDFSLAMGIDETLVSKIIRGRRELNDDQQAKWADALGCKVEDIFQPIK